MIALCTGTNPDLYQRQGVKIIPFPMIRLERIAFSEQMAKSFVDKLRAASMILFTSRFTVKFFFETLSKAGYAVDQATYGAKAVIAIGSVTARALRDAGWKISLTADEETSQGVYQGLMDNFRLSGQEILFPRSALPNPYLKTRLTEAGARVEEVALYTNTKPPRRPLPTEPIDAVIFTSPSTVTNFLRDYQTIPSEWVIFSRGPLTAAALRRGGYDSTDVKGVFQ